MFHIQLSSPSQDEKVLTSHQSASNDAVCRVDVVVDVHQMMTFEAELDTHGVGRTSTPRGDSVSQDAQT